MAPSITLRPRLLLVILCLIGALQPSQVQAALVQCQCQSRNFKAGETVLTAPSDRRTYCGHSVAWYYALQDNVLFHLHCDPTVSDPEEATVAIIDLKDQATRYQTFDSQQICNIEFPDFGVPPTCDKAYAVAKKLSQASVPYDRLTCNAQHYIDYLAFGKTVNRLAYPPNAACPVFRSFNRNTNIDDPRFRLAGQGGMIYSWPNGNRELKMWLASPSLGPTVSLQSSLSRGSNSSRDSNASPEWKANRQPTTRAATRMASSAGGDGRGENAGGSGNNGAKPVIIPGWLVNGAENLSFRQSPSARKRKNFAP